MGYSEYAAPQPLRGLVECGWSNVFPARGVPETVDILPDGCMDLLWTGAELMVAGPDTAPHPYRPVAGLPAAGLRYAPGRLPALLGLPAAELRDERAPLAEWHPALAQRAVARLEQGVAAGEVLVDLALALPGAHPEPGVRAVVHHVRRGLSAGQTADALGWTTRSLHRRCLHWFGYGPSVLRRVLRFRGALELLRAGVPPADVAARVGYADQPHLSREVRALAGQAPRQLADPG